MAAVNSDSIPVAVVEALAHGPLSSPAIVQMRPSDAMALVNLYHDAGWRVVVAIESKFGAHRFRLDVTPPAVLD